jgi:hypothetical protein
MLTPSPARLGKYPVTESSVKLPPNPRRSTCPKFTTTVFKVQNNDDAGPDYARPSGFDIRTFECPACDHVHQAVAELVDPMRSAKTNSWLHGQLQAPT